MSKIKIFNVYELTIEQAAFVLSHAARREDIDEIGRIAKNLTQIEVLKILKDELKQHGMSCAKQVDGEDYQSKIFKNALTRMEKTKKQTKVCYSIGA